MGRIVKGKCCALTNLPHLTVTLTSHPPFFCRLFPNTLQRWIHLINLKQLVERFVCRAGLASNGSCETSKYEKDQPQPLNTNEFIAAVLTFAPTLAPTATPACWRSLPDVSTRATSNYSHYLKSSISFTMI